MASSRGETFISWNVWGLWKACDLRQRMPLFCPLYWTITEHTLSNHSLFFIHTFYAFFLIDMIQAIKIVFRKKRLYWEPNYICPLFALRSYISLLLSLREEYSKFGLRETNRDLCHWHTAPESLSLLFLSPSFELQLTSGVFPLSLKAGELALHHCPYHQSLPIRLSSTFFFS